MALVTPPITDTVADGVFITHESIFISACGNSQFDQALAYLKMHPTLNVNHASVIPFYDDREHYQNGWTALHYVCQYGHAYNGALELIEYLLDHHPKMNFNVKSAMNMTPFDVACVQSFFGAIRLLSLDHRVDATVPKIVYVTANTKTPLLYATVGGYTGVIEHLMAASEEDESDDYDQLLHDEAKVAITNVCSEDHAIKILLEKLCSNTTVARHEMRLEHNQPRALIASLFAIVVFMCDGLLDVHQVAKRWPDDDECFEKKVSFLNIARQLPMELQMLLCHRVYGSAKNNILTQDSESAFRHLASQKCPKNVQHKLYM